ncbi:hypothetical protein FRC05_004567 [Tulasnella sp. 425]|nr:hypothetical protein FRC05_004567 [Tulasnella sp. 425]
MAQASRLVEALRTSNSSTSRLQTLSRYEKLFAPNPNIRRLHDAGVLDVLFEIVLEPLDGENPSRLDLVLAALDKFKTLVSLMEHPLRVYPVNTWCTKVNSIVESGCKTAEKAEKAGKRIPVRAWILTILETVCHAVFTKHPGIFHSTRLNHASILDLLYTTLFHRVDQAWGDPNVRRSIFKSLSKILIPHSASGLFFPDITRDAIRRYGPKRILERCTAFLNHGFILGTTSVIAQLSQVSTAHELLFATGRFHVTLLSKYWEWIKNPDDSPEDDPESRLQPLIDSSIRLISTCQLPESLQKTIIMDLVTEQDLIFLVGRTFVHFTVNVCDLAKILVIIRKKIAKFSREDAAFRTKIVKPSWFSASQWVKIAARSKPCQVPEVSPFHECSERCSSKMISTVDWWLAFGDEIGLDVARIEAEHQAAAQQAPFKDEPLKVGCGWLKCGFHGEEASLTFLLCSNCKSASLYSQKW